MGQQKGMVWGYMRIKYLYSTVGIILDWNGGSDVAVVIEPGVYDEPIFFFTAAEGE